jgi:hypothetical protein
MTRRNSLRMLCVALVLAASAVAGQARAADTGAIDNTGAIDGTWEGPWYRGMSSGRATFQIRDGGGSVQLTNAESFGEEPKPLSAVAFDGSAFKFRADGGGGPMTATLKLNERGDQMKGMGKYEGFGVRFELSRVRP